MKSGSPEQTRQLGVDLSQKFRKGEIVFLSGELGVGKTQFVKGVVKGLKGDESEVSSPTYALIHRYETPDMAVYHLDLYRLASAREVYSLGLAEIRREGLLLIEWPECGQPWLGEPDWEIGFDLLSDTDRFLNINQPSSPNAA